MLVAEDKILEILPQQPPMNMVSCLLEHDENHSLSQLFIKKENIFVKDGLFTEAGLIENMAQTAAAGTGYEASMEKREPRVGFIGSLKRIKIYSLPKTGEKIETKITSLTNLMNVQIVKGEVFLKGELIAEGEMNIFLQD